MDETEATGDGPLTCHAIIAAYYAHFNQRHFVEAAALFAADAVLEQLPLRTQERGGIGYLQFVSVWLRAFPDAVLHAERITSTRASTFDVELRATGTHRGALDLGGRVFRPNGAHIVLHLRELLQIEAGKIVFSTVSFDLHEIVDKLAKPDVALLLRHIRRLQELGEELSAGLSDEARTRDVVERVGEELDSARHVVRPYYKRSGDPGVVRKTRD